jgi:hypothetical protein
MQPWYNKPPMTPLPQPVRKQKERTCHVRGCANTRHPRAAGDRGGRQRSLLSLPLASLRLPVQLLMMDIARRQHFNGICCDKEAKGPGSASAANAAQPCKPRQRSRADPLYGTDARAHIVDECIMLQRRSSSEPELDAVTISQPRAGLNHHLGQTRCQILRTDMKVTLTNLTSFLSTCMSSTHGHRATSCCC